MSETEPVAVDIGLSSADPIMKELLGSVTSDFEKQLIIRYISSPIQDTIERFLDEYRRGIGQEG